jgi:hypothetical protein
MNLRDRDWEAFVDQFSTSIQPIISKPITSSRQIQDVSSKEAAEALAKQVEELSSKVWSIANQ